MCLQNQINPRVSLLEKALTVRNGPCFLTEQFFCCGEEISLTLPETLSLLVLSSFTRLITPLSFPVALTLMLLLFFSPSQPLVEFLVLMFDTQVYNCKITGLSLKPLWRILSFWPLTLTLIVMVIIFYFIFFNYIFTDFFTKYKLHKTPTQTSQRLSPVLLQSCDSRQSCDHTLASLPSTRRPNITSAFMQK